MADTETYRLSVQHAHDQSTVVAPLKHTVPRQELTETGLQSLVAEFTGTGSNNVTVGASGAITVNSVQQKHPVTGVNLDWDNYRGLTIVVDRAAVGTAPTATVSITATGFMGMTLTALAVAEDFVMSLRHASNKAASNTEALVVNLTGSTGYKVSVYATGKAT